MMCRMYHDLLKTAEMLVITSPIYYHGLSGQMKCCVDRFYAMLYPNKPNNLSKIACSLAPVIRICMMARCSHIKAIS